MKKARLAFLVATLLVVVTVLSSCGGVKAAKPANVFAENTDSATKIPTRVSDIAADGAMVREVSGKFVHFFANETVGTDGTTTPAKDMVYNIADGAMVYTFERSEDSSLSDMNFYRIGLYEAEFFAATVRKSGTGDEDDTFTTTLYDESGKQIAAVDRTENVHTTDVDLFLFGGKCYRVAADKSVAEFTAWNELSGTRVIDSLAVMTENYYYSYSEENGKVMTVYDRSLSYAASYRFPSYARDTESGILADGKVIFQYSTRLSDHEEEYDYIDGNGYKFALTTEILDAKTNRTKNIKIAYLIDSLTPRAILSSTDAFDLFDEKIKVVASVYGIKDRKVDKNSGSAEYVVMDENANVKSSLTAMFPGMMYMPEPVGNGLYCYTSHAGVLYLVGRDGKVIGDVSGVIDGNDRYILGESKLYNYDLSVAFDFDAQGLSYHYVSGDCATATGVFFEKADGSVCYYDGELKEIIPAAQTDEKSIYALCDEYYVVRDMQSILDVSYTLYSANGQELIASGAALSETADLDGVYIFSRVKDGKTVYYRIAP